SRPALTGTRSAAATPLKSARKSNLAAGSKDEGRAEPLQERSTHPSRDRVRISPDLQPAQSGQVWVGDQVGCQAVFHAASLDGEELQLSEPGVLHQSPDVVDRP